MSCCFHLHFIPAYLYSCPSSISKKTRGVYLCSRVPEIMMESVKASLSLQATATDASAFIRSMEMFCNTRRADACWIIIRETIMSSAGASVWMSPSKQCSESTAKESLVQSWGPSPSPTAGAMVCATIPCRHCINALVSVI